MILRNSWIKIIHWHFPWSNLYAFILCIILYWMICSKAHYNDQLTPNRLKAYIGASGSHFNVVHVCWHSFYWPWKDGKLSKLQRERRSHRYSTLDRAEYWTCVLRCSRCYPSVAKCGNIIACRRTYTRNIPEGFQKHFLCPGHKICVCHKCCVWQNEPIFGKHNHVQHCCCHNNMPAFCRTLKPWWTLFLGIAGACAWHFWRANIPRESRT